MIKLLIYDLDGTLIDSCQDMADAINWTLAQLGLKPLPAKRIGSFVGMGVQHLVTESLKEAPGPKISLPPVEKVIQMYRDRYADHLVAKTRLYPSVKRVLTQLKTRKQAVVTNKPEDSSCEILKRLGIDSYFFRVIGGDGPFAKKPSPAAILHLMRAARARPDETFFVGDSAIDIKTARNAGVRVAAVTYGFASRHEIAAAKPDFILSHFRDLITCPLLARENDKKKAIPSPFRK